eukprot:CAMPEP_0114169314 /NCGR_PEP_ID=MMETSP0043_2-20121206/33498_1 /TAXON_ID=464988 /ORGANISM="Hemiselmis andersenii, Strain CCMP644" /LENGTH=172 /DNA_ID=CAMNT_0001266759 /DNA_START=11 /DNA_END=525 /DNA_ORIENTATION=+
MWTIASICLWGWLLWTSAVMHSEYRGDIKSGLMSVAGLRNGWLLNLPIDLSDHQWRVLRGFSGALIVGMVVHVWLSSIARKLHPTAHSLFYAVSNIGFITFLHGKGTIWVLLVGAAVFSIGQVFKGSRLNPALTWALCIAVNCASDYYHGFEGVRFGRYLGSGFSWLDRYGG